MGRSRDEQRLDEIRTVIQENPDQKQAWIAQQVGYDNKTLQRALSQLEDRGDLLQENDHGQLRWFGRRK